MVNTASKQSILEQKEPVVFSFFSGSGFLDLGFENDGFEVVFVNEISKSFLRAYIHSRTKMNLPEPKYGYFNALQHNVAVRTLSIIVNSLRNDLACCSNRKITDREAHLRQLSSGKWALG